MWLAGELKTIIKKLEKQRIKIMAISCDNAAVNVAAVKLLNGDEI